MKIILKKYVYLSLFLPLLFLASSCDSGFDDINKNPNSTDKASPSATLTYVQRALGYSIYGVWNSGRQSNLCAQHWSQTNYTSEDRYKFRRETSDGFYRNTMFILQSCQDIINQNNDPLLKESLGSLYGDNAMQIATATIIKAWGMQLLLESFGPIPYTEAFQSGEILLPKYDSEQSVFQKIYEDLTKAVTALKASNVGWRDGDVIFGGDIDKWIKFGNSMRLRIALRQSNVNPEWKTLAKNAIAAGVMGSNDESAMVPFSGGGAPNDAPIYTGFISNGRNDFTITAQFSRLLRGLNDDLKGFKNPFEGLEDPRLESIIGPANYEQGFVNGIPYGVPDKIASSFFGDKSALIASMNLSDVDGKEVGLPLAIRRTFPSYLLDYPTVCFMISEVEDCDNKWFEKGVKASLSQWSADEDKVDPYVKEIVKKFDNAASKELKKEMIITQKYIHLYTQGFEAWSEYRRTGYPKSLVKPGEKTTTEVLDKGKVVYDGIFASANSTGGIVVPRLMYDSNEFTLNRLNYENGAKMLPKGDTYESTLWWAKK